MKIKNPDRSTPERYELIAWFEKNPLTKVTSQKVASMLGIEDQRAKNILNKLRDRRIINSRVIKNQNHFWSGTFAEDAESIKPADVAPSATFNNGTTSGLYLGEELRRHPGIPAERFAAFDLPSLVNGRQVPPRRPIHGCTTSLPYITRKDKCL